MRFNEHYFTEWEVSDVNLDDVYSDLNKKYFNGELPKIPIKFTTSKIQGGYVDLLRNTRTDEIKIVGMGISKFFKRDKDNFIQIMLHEMIHVALAYDGVHEREMHGIMFKRKLREIEDKSGITIPLTDSVDNVVSDDVKSKTVDVLLIAHNRSSNGENHIQWTVSPFLVDVIHKYILNGHTLKQSGRTTFVVRTDDRMLLKYPVSRKLEKTYNIKYYKINIDDAMRILDQGIGLYEF